MSKKRFDEKTFSKLEIFARQRARSKISQDIKIENILLGMVEKIDSDYTYLYIENKNGDSLTRAFEKDFVKKYEPDIMESQPIALIAYKSNRILISAIVSAVDPSTKRLVEIIPNFDYSKFKRKR